MPIIFYCFALKFEFLNCFAFPICKREMAQPNVTLISDLDILKDDSTVKVKVINLWNLFSFYNNDELFSIELILIDEQGTKIQANVLRKNIYRLKNILKDGLAFYIQYPSFASQRMGGFTLTRQHHKLTFVHNTVLTECHDFSGPAFGFEFVDYQSIISLTHPENTTIDVIGLVVAIGEVGKDNDDIKKHRLNIQIQDANGLQLSVNLWGDFAYKMQRLDGDDRPDSSTNTLTLMKSNKVSEHDDFMVKFQLKTIADVSEPVELGFSTQLYPGEINALKGLKLAFKISISRFNVSNNNNQYSICRVSDDEKLIEELENKFTFSQVGNSQSFDIGEADSESQDNRILKDAISRTDDNITPYTIDKNSATSPMKGFNTPTVLKRNLEEVFDLELNEHLSLSKTPKISPE
ncbi:unnamed protein product [Lactuca saligna]|uniref:Replication protein A 70 kDa DNA-binding subunit B/D first OB fold domain-containing protein n=1 Tax=Lactuca saligna TaxID=75948 RepID=A0AA35Z8M2_LACSI|nr:unnamed protein product [Lactuca saligna]